MKKILSIIFSMIIISASLFTYSAFAKSNKVAICHFLGDGARDGEYVVIVISEKAAVSHVREHGDLPLNILSGLCGEDPLPPPLPIGPPPAP
jgi:hypothetical protein